MKGFGIMARLIKKEDYMNISYGEKGYTDLSGFTEVSDETSKKGEISIIDSSGSKRVRLSKNLFSLLDEPEAVKVLTNDKDKKVVFIAIPKGTPKAYHLGKGAVIYSPSLAEAIISVAKNVEFTENTTTRCGSIEKVQTNENGCINVILNFD